MAEKIPVEARQYQKFGRKIIKPGEQFMVTEREAKWLKALGRVNIVEHVEPEAPKRTYQRRDMVAEQSAAAPVPREPPTQVNAWPYPKTPLQVDPIAPADADDGQE